MDLVEYKLNIIFTMQLAIHRNDHIYISVDNHAENTKTYDIVDYFSQSQYVERVVKRA